MPILKAPPAQPKNETIQLRVSHEMRVRLVRYAEFIHASTSYVVVEALNRIFDKDHEFKVWLELHPDSVPTQSIEIEPRMETIKES